MKISSFCQAFKKDSEHFVESASGRLRIARAGERNPIFMNVNQQQAAAGVANDPSNWKNELLHLPRPPPPKIASNQQH
jgi:hypothetical protein